MCRSTLAQWNYREKFNNSSENVRFPNTIMYSSNMCTLLSNVISFLSTTNFWLPQEIESFPTGTVQKTRGKVYCGSSQAKNIFIMGFMGGPNMFNFNDYSAWRTVSYYIPTHPTLKICNTCPIVYSCQMTRDRSSCETEGLTARQMMTFDDKV